MKTKCNECGAMCNLELELNQHANPTKCPLGFSQVHWREVTEPAALPKLTVEELERRGIEWPEWAKYAVVEQSGQAAFSSDADVAIIYQGREPRYWDTCAKMLPGQWDATDWMHSKIMRPAKVEQPPDWLKLGAWAAVGKFVGKIDWMSRDASEFRITCGESRFAKTGEVKPVTWRAWTFEEAPMSVKVKMSDYDPELEHGDVISIVYDLVDERQDGAKRYARFKERDCIYWEDATGELETGRFSTADEVLENCEQLSGLPCGVPQVDGADLEG